MTNPLKSLALGVILFLIALIDSLITKANSFSDFGWLGKLCCVGILIIIAYWIVQTWIVPLIRKK